MTELTGAFFRTDALTLAERLIGKTLVCRDEEGALRAVITETEAYMGVTDRASHAYGGRRTARVETMYRPGGYAYVYRIYGVYYCLNITAANEGNPEAVLIRAAFPTAGLDRMLANIRSFGRHAALPDDPGDLTGRDRAKLLNGPGKLCRAMGITRADDGQPFGDGSCRFSLLDEGYRPRIILRSPRIGIDYAGEAKDYPWRFTVAAEKGVPVWETAETPKQ